MEQAKEKFQADIKLLEKAFGTLKEAIQKKPSDEIVRDAVIKRFEYVYELSWKTIKAGAQYMGTECNSPREAIRAAYKMEWINDDESWFSAIEARNKTSHMYNLEMAEEVYEVAKDFPKLVDALLVTLKKVN